FAPRPPHPRRLIACRSHRRHFPARDLSSHKQYRRPAPRTPPPAPISRVGQTNPAMKEHSRESRSRPYPRQQVQPKEGFGQGSIRATSVPKPCECDSWTKPLFGPKQFISRPCSQKTKGRRPP